MVPAVLITRATGFVGSHLTEALAQKGYIVHAVARPTSDLMVLEKFNPERVRIHIYNEEHQFNAILGEIPLAERPQVVFHLAAMMTGTPAYDDIAPLLQSNLIFGAELLEGMRLYGIERLVNAGTFWQHYQNEDYNPVNLYAATKQAFQDIEVYYERAHSFKIINLHLFDNYGPGDHRKKVLNLLKQAGKDGTVLNMTPGEQMMDLVYIDDLVQAFILAGQYLMDGQYGYCGTYAVSSGKPITLRNLVEMIQKMMKIKINVNWGRASI